MKTRTLILALLAVVALSMSAQSDYSKYLNKAMEKLEEGDCESARKMYNVYKDLAKDSIPSVEILLEDCTGGLLIKPTDKKYAINDKIPIGDYLYRVAYIEDEGTHGFAVYDYGTGPLTEQLRKNRQVPIRSEMALIAKNASKLNLNDRIFYWTSDHAYTSPYNNGFTTVDREYYYCYKFKGKETQTYNRKESKGILLIYRF